MARKPRVHYEGAIYHIVARGNNREPVFHESADKKKYLEYLKDSIIKYEFALYGYVLMDNVRLNITYEELVDDICAEFGINQGDILSKTRTRRITSARNKLICKVIANQIMTQAGIADRLNIDASRVSRVYQQMKTNKSIVKTDSQLT